MSSNLWRSCTIITCLFVLGGCAGTLKSPDYVSPDLNTDQITKIEVINWADVRRNKNLLIPKLTPAILDDWTSPSAMAVDELEDKGFEVVPPENNGSNPAISASEISRADPSWIKSLGNPSSRWIFLPTLNTLLAGKERPRRYYSECGGILYDKFAGKAVWQHRGKGRTIYPMDSPCFGLACIGNLSARAYFAANPDLPGARAASLTACIFGLVYQSFPPKGWTAKKQGSVAKSQIQPEPAICYTPRQCKAGK